MIASHSTYKRQSATYHEKTPVLTSVASCSCIFHHLSSLPLTYIYRCFWPTIAPSWNNIARKLNWVYDQHLSYTSTRRYDSRHAGYTEGRLSQTPLQKLLFPVLLALPPNLRLLFWEPWVSSQSINSNPVSHHHNKNSLWSNWPCPSFPREILLALYRRSSVLSAGFL